MLATLDIDAIRTALRVNGGFTLDANTGRLLTVGEDTGYAVAIPGTEQIIGDTLTADAFRDAFDAAMSADVATDYGSDVFIGGWYSEDRGYMIELTTVHNIDRGAAMLLGVLRDQDAIFNLANGEEIDLRGNVLSLSA